MKCGSFCDLIIDRLYMIGEVYFHIFIFRWTRRIQTRWISDDRIHGFFYDPPKNSCLPFIKSLSVRSTPKFTLFVVILNFANRSAKTKRFETAWLHVSKYSHNAFYWIMLAFSRLSNRTNENIRIYLEMNHNSGSQSTSGIRIFLQINITDSYRIANSTM